MREVTDKFNSIRKSGTKPIKRRFLLFFEGFRTEVQYFTGLKNNRQQFRISSLIEMSVMCRYPMDAGVSDPMRLVELVDEYMTWLKGGKYTIRLFMNSYLCQELSESYIFAHNDNISEFMVRAEKSLNVVNSEGLISNIKDSLAICNKVYRDVFEKDPQVEFMPIRPDFDEGLDVVCIIVDRDKDNRTSSKCSDFFSTCKDKNFVPIMTNPCFEFWLLLHFEEVLTMDKKMIMANEYSEDRRYLENVLDEILRGYIPTQGYDKMNLDCGRFAHRVEDAIRNEKHFCNNIKCIKNEIGSNIGYLISMMRE